MRRFFTIGLSCLLLLAGCDFDWDIYEGGECVEGETFYLSLVLGPQGDPAATKAGESTPAYNTGTIGELLVKTLDLYFYREDGTYQGHESITDFKQFVKENTDDLIGNTVGAVVVKLPYRPYRMLVGINLPDGTLFEGKLLSTALESRYDNGSWALPKTTVRYDNGSTVTDISDVSPFYMTPSTYLNQAGQTVCDVLIPQTYLFDNETEALGKPIAIYMDRVAAKVRVRTVKKAHPVPVVTGRPGIVTRVELLGWGLNATNNSAWYFKQLSPDWTFSWGGLSWNDAAKYRSHWAKDPNYKQDPDLNKQDGAAIPTLPGASPTGAGGPFHYLTGGDIKNALAWSDDDAAYLGEDYCLENTADGASLPVSDDVATRTLFSRTTHLLVKARLVMSKGEGVTDDPGGYTAEGADLFRYNGVFYTAGDLAAAVFADSDWKFYKDAAGEQPLLPADIVVKGAREAGRKSYQDQDVVLTTTVSPLYVDKASGTVEAYSGGAALPLQRGGELLRVDGFKGGKFYYAIPVEHLENADASTATYPEAKYGVVRNHCYEITLGAIAGIGTGIWDEGWEILPVRRNDDYEVSAYMTVTPWKVLEQRFLFYDPTRDILFGPIIDGQMIQKRNIDEIYEFE